MTKSRISIPEKLLLITIVSLFLPGEEKTFLVIALTTALYTVIAIKYKIYKNYFFLLVYIFSLSSILFISTSNIRTSINLLLVWILPYMGVKMQSANYHYISDPRKRWKRHIFCLMLLYAVFALRITISNVDDYQSGITGMMFHSSTLALIGTLLSLEILRDSKSKYLTTIALGLLLLPIIGALRQYVYIIVPVLVGVAFDRKLRTRVICAGVILLTLLILTPLGKQLETFRSHTLRKASSIGQYLAAATDPEEHTINERTQWWIDAIERTSEENVLFGHMLKYRFSPRGVELYPSGMLHNYFITAYADGGLVLLMIIVVIFLKNIIKAVKRRDYYTVLAIYAFIVVFAVNGTATTHQKAYILFYLYGYYEMIVMHYNNVGEKYAKSTA